MKPRFTQNLLQRRRFIFLILLLCAPMPSEANDDADIGEIQIKGRNEYESLESAGSFATIIKPDKYFDQSKTTPEILSETLGVDVTNLGGEGQLSTLSIRGSSAEQVAVFVDGVRLNSSTFGAVDFSTIPLDAIERIEVIRGATSARFGTDAIGGVINIVTKEAHDKRSIDVKLTGGSFLTLKTAESWSEPFKSGDMTLAHSHRSTAGDFTFKTAAVNMAGGRVGASKTRTRENNRSIAENVLAKGRIRLSENSKISLANDFFWTDREVPGMEEETTLLSPANPLEGKQEIFRNTSNVLFEMEKLFVEPLSFQSGVTFFLDNDNFKDSTPAIGNPIDVTYRSYAPEAHAQFMHIASWRDVNFATTARGQYRFDYSNDISPIPSAPTMGSHTRNTGAFFLEEVAGFLGDRLILSPQVRLEKATARKFRASWRVGLSGKPLPWLTLKSNVQTAYRYPNFSELYYPDQGYLRGNPRLKDEQSLNFDAGFIISPKYVSLEFSFFQNRIENQIIFVPISATTIEPVNTNKAITNGIEVGLNIDPIKQLHLEANYTWMDSKFAGGRLRLPGRPEHKLNIGVRGTIKPVILFGTLQYIGSFPSNTSNTVWISDHTAIDLGATVKFSKYFFATAEVKDVTNVQIYDARGFPLPRRSYWVTLGAGI